MRVLCSLRLAAGLLALLGSEACSSERNSTPTAVATKFEPPASRCVVPEIPLPIGTNRVVGSGSAASCTEQALRQALAEGGDISFDCGNSPAVIAIGEEIVVPKDASIDGADLVTLDGGGVARILHTAARVTLTVKRMSFVRGHAQPSSEALGSGGAIRVGWLGKLNRVSVARLDRLVSVVTAERAPKAGCARRSCWLRHLAWLIRHFGQFRARSQPRWRELMPDLIGVRLG